MDTDYAQFLASKAPRAQASGIEPGPMPGHLFDFQAHCVAFCIKQGRAGLYLDTGPDDEEWWASGDAQRNSHGCWLDAINWKRRQLLAAWAEAGIMPVAEYVEGCKIMEGDK